MKGKTNNTWVLELTESARTNAIKKNKFDFLSVKYKAKNNKLVGIISKYENTLVASILTGENKNSIATIFLFFI